jgi:dihydrodipicolinate synthase/N-acetylneuraminate lyase
MVHVGAGNMHESIELARHAEAAGAMAVSAAPPTYFKPGSTKALVTYCKVCLNTDNYHYKNIQTILN